MTQRTHPQDPKAFPFEIRQGLGGMSGRGFIRATCRYCERDSDLPAPSPNSEYGHKAFQRIGWAMGSRRTRDVCPECQGARRDRLMGGAAVLDTPPENAVLVATLELSDRTPDPKPQETTMDTVTSQPDAGHDTNTTLDELLAANHLRPAMPPTPPDPVPRAKGPKNSLTFTQRLAIADVLRSVCILAEDGLAAYAVGQDDSTVAAAMPFPCTVANVASVRMELIGKLRPTPVRGSPDLTARVDQLERLVYRLCAELGLDSNKSLD